VDVVAIISVASSAAVALGAIGANLWQQRRSFDHDREMADRASARSSLVDTMAVLHRVGYAVDEVSQAVRGHADTIADPEFPERLEPVQHLEEVGRELDRTIGLIQVQLGPGSSATKSLEEAGKAALTIFRKTKMIRFPTRNRDVAVVGERNEN